jgi:hypothetical protein
VVHGYVNLLRFGGANGGAHGRFIVKFAQAWWGTWGVMVKFAGQMARHTEGSW